jgi:hypothetical protein
MEFTRQQQVEAIGRQELHTGARGQLLGVVDVISGHFIDTVSVTIKPTHRHTRAHLVRQRTTNRTFRHRLKVRATQRESAIAPQLGSWLGSNQIDCAAGCITAVQGTLRSTQHFDAFQVEHGAHLRTGLGDHRAVDMQRH